MQVTHIIVSNTSVLFKWNQNTQRYALALLNKHQYDLEILYLCYIQVRMHYIV